MISRLLGAMETGYRAVTPPVYHSWPMQRFIWISIVAASISLAANRPASMQSSTAADCSTITAANSDDCIRLNQIQVLGTHNSYHLAGTPDMQAALGARARNLDYTHTSLLRQLAMLNIRQFELDIFADPDGGLFASPLALTTIPGLKPPGPEMRTPGFKVLHVPDVDFRSTCTTLKACLLVIRGFSHLRTSHVPIMIMIEAKDEPLADPDKRGYVKPLPIDAEGFRALDREIRSVFSDDEMITPDRVRGSHPTLAAAVQKDGWPTLRASRGKVMFALDNTDHHRDLYLQGNPSLEGRVLFVSSTPLDPWAGFMKMNEALGDDEERIRQMVKAGYLVRTRSDIPTEEARSGSTLRRDAAFRSGAQFVSTDYPEPSPFGSGYVASLPGAPKRAARCNPVTAPSGCRTPWLEPLFVR